MAPAPGYQNFGYDDPLARDPSVLVRGLKKRSGITDPTDPLNPNPAIPNYPATFPGTSTVYSQDPGNGEPGSGAGPDPGGGSAPTPTPTPNPTPPAGSGPDPYDPFVKAKNWQGLFQELVKNFASGTDGYGLLTSNSSEFVKQLQKYGFHISPANASGEVTKVQTPDGHWVRVLQGPKGAYQWTWVDQGDGTGGGAGATSSQSMIDSLLAAFQGNAADRAKLHTTINGLLDKYSKDPTADDPIIKGQVDAYHGISERSLADAQAQMAERAHTEGVTSGAYDSQIQNATLTQGRQEGALQSGLMAQELLNRRKSLSDILNTNAAMLSDEDKMNLQARIAGLDESLRNQQFYDELARMLANDANGSDAALIRAILGL